MSETIESTAIAVTEETQQPAPNHGEIALRSAFDIKPQVFQAGLDRRKKNRKALITWIQEELVEGVDWGRIHVVKKNVCQNGRYCTDPYHFSKPSLWKAGAEKIVGMMGLRSEWPTLRDYESAVMAGKPIIQIMLRCQLLNDAGAVVSEGIGARAMAQDYEDMNKAFKMAKKSSLIDAVLNLAGLSEIFTQDIEDMDPASLPAGSPDPFNPREEPGGDVFPRGQQKPVSTHCPIGKEWKGKEWSEVDEGFLKWIAENITDKPDLVKRALKELGSRSVQTDEVKTQKKERKIDKAVDQDQGEKKLADYAREITAARSLDQIILIKETLPEKWEPALRAYLQTREKELGPK